LISIVVIIFVLNYKEQLKKFTINKKFNPRYYKKRPVSRNRAYELFLKVPYLREYILNLRKKLYIAKPQDEYLIESKAIAIASISFLITVVIFIFIYKLYGKNAYMTAVIFVGCIYLNNVISNRFIKSTDIQLLSNMPEFISDIKHHYHSCDMVDEAIYEASKIARNNVAVQGKEIYKVITKSNGQMWLDDYYENCPNKFLKILAGFSYLIKEYGDKKVNNVSLYIKNLNYISEEINLEIIKSKQLGYWLKGLAVIAIVPLIFPPLIENWMSSSFPAAKEFFSSSIAFFLKNFIIFLVILCYFFLLQIKKNEHKAYTAKQKERTIDYKLLKVKFLSECICLIKPKKGSLRYKNLEFLIQDSGSPLNIDCIYLRKLFAGLVTFIIMISIFATSHFININIILNDSAYGIKNQNYYLMIGKLAGMESVKQQKINKFDNEIISAVSKFSKKINEQNFKKVIENEIKKSGYKDEALNVAINRIFNKLTGTNKEVLSILEILLSLLISLILSNIPVWILMFRRSLRKVDMQDEVFQFHTIIILLMHHDNVDVQNILEWMYQFSDIFKGAINRCLNNFQNPYFALERLKEDVKYKPFSNLIENLQMATDKINIISAFDSLELEREFYKENRKETNKQTVAKKIELGRFIGFIPFYAVIVLYMVVPLVFTSFMSLKSIMGQLSTL
jgi:hypothetical protein